MNKILSEEPIAGNPLDGFCEGFAPVMGWIYSINLARSLSAKDGIGRAMSSIVNSRHVAADTRVYSRISNLFPYFAELWGQ